MTIPMRPVSQDHTREMWETKPMEGQTLYVAFSRKRCPSGRVIRKYLSVAGRGFTENRWKCWKTTDRAEAERRAANLQNGHVAEWKP